VAVNNADVEGVSVEMFPAPTIRVETEWESSSDKLLTVAAGARVHLTPEVRRLGNDEYWSRTMNLGEGSVDVVERVLPGSYRVTVQANGRGYLASLRSGQTDLVANMLVVTQGAEAAPIQAVFRSGAATLHGTVKNAGGAPCWIVVTPDSDSAVEYNPISVSGQFTISGLAPGAYHVYAFPSIDGLEYRNREAMRKFENRATSVSVSENETKQIEVELAGGAGT
jgi:hypothetical protein